MVAASESDSDTPDPPDEPEGVEYDRAGRSDWPGIVRRRRRCLTDLRRRQSRVGILDRWRRPKVEFAEPDRLTRAIQRAIDELLAEGTITRKFAEEPEEDDDRYNGFCARAVQVYWRLATRDPEYQYLANDPDVEPYKLGKGADAHYRIRLSSGRPARSST
jgi:hypothetical protein